MQQIDADEFTEQQYARLLEMMDELRIQQKDTNYYRTHQDLFYRMDRCLNQRQGYRHVTPESQAANKSYLGDPWHHTLRYQMHLKDQKQHVWHTGLVLDKDAGEAWQKRLPWADSFSLFAAYQSRTGIVRQAIAGHYRLQLGSGLVLNQQFTLGKNVMGNEFLRQTPRLSPHASTSESGRMLGTALRLRLHPHLELLPFVSFQPIDGVVERDTLTSWATDGYHRTTSEERKRNSSWLINIGTRAQTMGEWWEVGVNVLYSRFEHNYCRPLRQYNQHYYRGQELAQGSVDYRLRYWGFQLRGEMAIDDRGGWAMIHGL
ncbi:MAG: hypothetical protein Q4B58_05180, partial [Bacteroidales bacterium]|nr:hypothetical protein [Bacteroidales bacterium]